MKINLFLSPRSEQHCSAVRLVVNAYSTSYSEWNLDETWSSQEWKSDELMEDRNGRPVVHAQQTDKFIVENDSMDSYRSRIRNVGRIQILLAQGERLSAKESANPQKMQRKTATNIL